MLSKNITFPGWFFIDDVLWIIKWKLKH